MFLGYLLKATLIYHQYLKSVCDLILGQTSFLFSFRKLSCSYFRVGTFLHWLKNNFNLYLKKRNWILWPPLVNNKPIIIMVSFIKYACNLIVYACENSRSSLMCLIFVYKFTNVHFLNSPWIYQWTRRKREISSSSWRSK